MTTSAYCGSLPGNGLRDTAGDRVRVAVRNDLPEATGVHRHGLAIRNDMDGVLGVNTPEVAPGGSFGFDFVMPDPGTYWFHPHHGIQLDCGDAVTARPRQRVRLRLINAAADTIFDVALAGHQLRVTHTDGFPVTPVTTRLRRLGMGMGYDAIVTIADGVFPLVVARVGKGGQARAVVRTGSGTVPPTGSLPSELDGYPLTVDALRAGPGTALPTGDLDSVPDDLLLSGSMVPYVWTINGRTYDDTVPLTIRQGQAGRLRIRNHSMMPHPIHLHRHTFQLGSAGGTGPRKDTVLVPAMVTSTSTPASGWSTGTTPTPQGPG